MVSLTVNVDKEMRKATTFQISASAKQKMIGMVNKYIMVLTGKSEDIAKENNRLTIRSEDISENFDENYQADLVDIVINRLDEIEEKIDKINGM